MWRDFRNQMTPLRDEDATLWADLEGMYVALGESKRRGVPPSSSSLRDSRDASTTHSLTRLGSTPSARAESTERGSGGTRNTSPTAPRVAAACEKIPRAGVNRFRVYKTFSQMARRHATVPRARPGSAPLRWPQPREVAPGLVLRTAAAGPTNGVHLTRYVRFYCRGFRMMLRGRLVVHGADLEKLARAAIRDSGLRLSWDREEDLLAELLLVAWELSQKHDERRYPGGFAKGCYRRLRFRVTDGSGRPKEETAGSSRRKAPSEQSAATTGRSSKTGTSRSSSSTKGHRYSAWTHRSARIVVPNWELLSPRSTWTAREIAWHISSALSVQLNQSS